MPAEFLVDSDLSPEKGGQLRKAAHLTHASVSYLEAQVKNCYCGVEPLGWHIFDTSATDNQILGPAKTRRVHYLVVISCMITISVTLNQWPEICSANVY